MNSFLIVYISILNFSFIYLYSSSDLYCTSILLTSPIDSYSAYVYFLDNSLSLTMESITDYTFDAYINSGGFHTYTKSSDFYFTLLASADGKGIDFFWNKNQNAYKKMEIQSISINGEAVAFKCTIGYFPEAKLDLQPLYLFHESVVNEIKTYPQVLNAINLVFNITITPYESSVLSTNATVYYYNYNDINPPTVLTPFSLYYYTYYHI